MTTHKSEARRKQIEKLWNTVWLSYRSPCGIGVWPWRKRNESNFVLLRLPLFERSNHKRHIPDPSCWDFLIFIRRDVFHKVGFGFSVLADAPQETRPKKIGFACEMGFCQWKRMFFGLRGSHVSTIDTLTTVWKEVWKPHNVLRWWRCDCDINRGRS